MNAAARAALGHEIADDGIFWMPKADWKAQFEDFAIGHWGQNDFMKVVDVDWPRNFSEEIVSKKWTLENPVAQSVWLGVSQAADRTFMDDKCKDGARLKNNADLAYQDQ